MVILKDFGNVQLVTAKAIYPLEGEGEASAFAGFFRLPASTGALASSLRGAADAAELFSSNDLPCRGSGWSLHQQQ